MGYETNPYYNPEALGLTTVAEADTAGSYEFDMFVVWTDGRTLYWGTDSGCSCPTPFEEIKSRADLSTGSRKECLAAIDVWLFDEYHSDISEVRGLRSAVEAWRRS